MGAPFPPLDQDVFFVQALIVTEYLFVLGNDTVKLPYGQASGTAAAVLGIGFKPAGYKQWKFENGQGISDAGVK